MSLDIVRDIDSLMLNSKYIFILIYSEWCNSFTKTIDNFFNDKYDLNKKYLKVNINYNIHTSFFLVPVCSTFIILRKVPLLYITS